MLLSSDDVHLRIVPWLFFVSVVRFCAFSYISVCLLAFAFFVILAVLNLIIGIFQKPHVYIDGEKIIFGKSEIDGRRIDTIKMDFGTWVYRGTVQSAKITLFCGLCETEIKHPSIALLFALMKVCKNAKIKTGLIKRLVISSLCFVFLGLVLACVFMK